MDHPALTRRPITSDSEFFFALLRVTTAQVFRAAGIERCPPSVLDTATDLVRRHLLLLASESKQLAEENGRPRVELADLAQAMQAVGLVHPHSSIDMSNGWDSVEREESAEMLQEKKRVLREEIVNIEKAVEDRRQAAAAAAATGSNANSDKTKEIPYVGMTAEEQTRRSQLQYELSVVSDSYDYTTYRIEKDKTDSCVSGFINFVEWAKGNVPAAQRLIAHGHNNSTATSSNPPSSITAGAALPDASASSNTADQFTKSHTKSASKSRNDLLLASKPPGVKLEDASKSLQSGDAAAESLQKDAAPTTAAATTDHQLNLPEEWLLALMKKQAKVGYETRFTNTALAVTARSSYSSQQHTRAASKQPASDPFLNTEPSSHLHNTTEPDDEQLSESKKRINSDHHDTSRRWDSENNDTSSRIVIYGGPPTLDAQLTASAAAHSAAIANNSGVSSQAKFKVAKVNH